MDVSKRVENLLNELYKFHSDVIILGDSIQDDRLEDFEKSIGYFAK